MDSIKYLTNTLHIIVSNMWIFNLINDIVFGNIQQMQHFKQNVNPEHMQTADWLQYFVQTS